MDIMGGFFKTMRTRIIIFEPIGLILSLLLNMGEGGEKDSRGAQHLIIVSVLFCQIMNEIFGR